MLCEMDSGFGHFNAVKTYAHEISALNFSADDLSLTSFY
jgi:hypothetical protein